MTDYLEILKDDYIKMKNKSGKEITLYRLRAKENIETKIGTTLATKGRLGGYIESENPDCKIDNDPIIWIDKNSKIYGFVHIKNNTLIKDSEINGDRGDEIEIKDSIILNCDIISEDDLIIKNSRLENLNIDSDIDFRDIHLKIPKELKDLYTLPYNNDKIVNIKLDGIEVRGFNMKEKGTGENHLFLNIIIAGYIKYNGRYNDSKFEDFIEKINVKNQKMKRKLSAIVEFVDNYINIK